MSDPIVYKDGIYSHFSFSGLRFRDRLRVLLHGRIDVTYRIQTEFEVDRTSAADVSLTIPGRRKQIGGLMGEEPRQREL